MTIRSVATRGKIPAIAKALAVLVLLAGPFAAQAQPPPGKTARIGYLSFRSGPTHLDEAFRQGLRELGYVEKQNIAVEYRWADFNSERASALAAELVRLKVDVIIATGGPIPATVAKRATRTIPIVFAVNDPVGVGLVTSLDRPDGNLTGINLLTAELNAKRLELLKEVMPGISQVAVLVNPGNPPTPRALKELENAARPLRVKLQIVEASDRGDIDQAFTAMNREGAEALLVLNDPMFFAQRERIVDLAAKQRLPGIFQWREFADAGGLLSYGGNITGMFRRLPTYVDKILKGAKPGDLTIEQPTKFEFVINLRTAKALRLTISQSILDRADQVIPP